MRYILSWFNTGSKFSSNTSKKKSYWKTEDDDNEIEMEISLTLKNIFYPEPVPPKIP
jgi:hypothetical protein